MDFKVSNTLTATCVLFASFNTYAAATVDAVAISYIEATACNSTIQKAIKVAGDPTKPAERDDVYAVVWSGDLGCGGYSASYGSHILMLSIAWNGEPKAIPDNHPEFIPTKDIMSVKGESGLMIIKGSVALPDDPSCCPTGRETFVYKFDSDDFIMKQLK